MSAQAEEIRQAVRRYAAEQLAPHAARWDREKEFPREALKGLAEMGLYGVAIAEEWGGAGMDYTSLAVACEEISAGDCATATIVAVNNLVAGILSGYGNQNQKEKFLKPLAQGRMLGAFALTEPLHGSDSIGLETSARRDGDTWRIDGQKKWIGNGTLADVIVLWARDTGDGQVKGFLVEKGTPGFDARRIDGKASLRSVWQAEITLTDVRVPEENRLPGARSFKDAGRVLAGTRNAVAWAALGHATAAYEIAMAYASERIQFGKPLISFQITQDRLVKMLAEVCSMQLYCLRLGRLMEEGQLTDTIAAIAKMNNTRKAREVVSQARDVLGGNGILLDFHVMRHMADMEALHTYEGTETIQTLIVGREITGVGAFA